MLPPLDVWKGIPSAPDHSAINHGHDLQCKSLLSFGLNTLLELGPIFYPENYGGYSIHGQGIPMG